MLRNRRNAAPRLIQTDLPNAAQTERRAIRYYRNNLNRFKGILDEHTALKTYIHWCDGTTPAQGSTFLCQLLAQHPDVHCEGFSSPLCNLLLGIRRMVSDDSFFLSQLDTSFDTSYAHLASAMKGFLREWHHNAGGALVVDKNRAWLHAIELLLHIEPEARLIVCIRDFGQIYGSIEAQHQRTILVDFIDHLADYDRFGRADMLFAKDKVIGAPLISLHAVPDLPKKVQERLYFVRFEDLMEKPARLHVTSFNLAWFDTFQPQSGCPFNCPSRKRQPLPHEILAPANHSACAARVA